MRRLLPALLSALLLAACGSSADAPAAAPSAAGGLAVSGCEGPLAVGAAGNRDHIPEDAKASYKTDPPVAGQHYAKWANTGIHTEPVPDGYQVHNLEHGHVVIQYRDLTADEVKTLRELVLADPLMVLLAPRPSMDARLALTSWGVIQTCDTVPDNVGDVVQAFIKANRDNAPESIPGQPAGA